MKLKNKKGMLLAEETLKTVLAVIAIGILIYFLISLYFGNLNEERQKKAEATLERISEIVDSSAESGEVRAITPDGWYLFGFAGEVKPNSCASQSCICICENKWDLIFLSEIERQANECSDEGRCLKIENLVPFEEIEILDIGDSPTNIKVSKKDGKVRIEKIK